MKNKYLFLFLIGFVSLFSTAQAPGNISVTANSAADICNPGDCTTLTSTYFQTYQTTGYNVGPIPYNPPFGTTAGSATSLTIDDRWSGIIDLKGITPQDFNFCFYGNSYIQCLVSTNGTITFSIAGSVAGGLYSPNTFSTWVNSGPIPFAGPSGNAPFKNSINGVFQDTDPSVNNAFASPNINYYTTGVYPHRVFVVNVANVAQYGCSSNATVGAQTSQMMLYEGTNIIDVYVARRYPCVSWSSGNGLIGVQNNAGTLGTVPPGRNGGTWQTINEAWRFTPNGVPVVPTFQWTDSLGNVVGNTQNVNVCPAGTATYTVTATYPTCSPAVNYQVRDNVTVNLANVPGGAPTDLYQCDTGATTYTWDFTPNNNDVINGIPPADLANYSITYHESLASAQLTDADMITGSITSYPTSGGTVPIWVTVEDLNTGCRKVQTFNLIVRNCDATPVQPPNLVACDVDGNGTESFDLTQQNTPILGGQNPADYIITYHTSLASADGTTPNSALILPGTAVGQEQNFVSAGQTIYVRFEDATDSTVFGNTTFQLIVNPRPIITGTLNACVGATTQLSSTATPDPSTPWVSSDTAVATVNSTGLVTAVAPGTSIITYTDINGCVNSATVTINELPTVTVNSPETCQGGTVTMTATPGIAGTYNYAWTVPTGVANPGNVASFTTTVAGAYGVIITNPVTNCSSLSGAGNVTINPLPTVTVNSPSICSGNPATVTATPGSAATFSYAWTVPAGFANPGNVASFSTTVAGTYSVIITDVTTTCSSASASGTVTINTLPTVTVNSPVACAGNAVTMTATPGSAATYSYVWTVPAGATNPGNVATFNTTVAGTYSVVITNLTTTCSSASASGTATINPLPTVTVNSPSICAGETATVTATPGTAGTYTYAWTVPAGVTNPGDVASFTTTTTGTYSVVITNTTTTCSSASASGTVSPKPAGGPLTLICAGSSPTSVAFDWNNISGITMFNYTYTIVATGTTVSGSQAGPSSITIPTPVNSPVTFTLQPIGSVCVPPQTITCNCPDPQINAVTNKSVCSGQVMSQIDFATSDPYDSVRWEINDPSIGVGLPASGTTFFIPSFTAANVAVQQVATVTVYLTKYGCEGPGRTFTITINALPTVTVNSPTICAGANATLTATPGNGGTYAYAWTVPVGVTNPGNVASFNTSTAGNYSVVITRVSTGCASASATATVTVNPLPTVTVNSPTVCTGTAATVTATPGSAGTYNYVWTVPTGATNPGNVASFTSTTPGTYSVVITNTATNCSSASASGTVGNNAIPTVAVNSPSVCSGASATVTATPGTSATYTYAWTVPTGAANPGNVSSFSTNIAGTYSVIITNTTTTCSSASASGTVVINALPTVTVNSPTVCTGATATVTATPGTAATYTYAWTVPAGVTNPGSVSSFNTTIAGNYSVIITNTTTSCSSASASGTVSVNPLPTVTVNSSTVCTGAQATVTATPGSAGTYSYAWTVPTGVTNPGNVATFTTSTTGTYSVIITNTTTGCSSASASGSVNNNAVPTAVVNSPAICAGAAATVTATPGAAGTYSYAWTVPTGATNPGNVASFATTTPGTYSVIITNTATTCSSVSASGTVTVNPLPTVTVNSPTVCSGANATVTATPGTADTYNYVWTVPAGVPNPGNVASFTTVTPGNYSVVITNTTTTCTSTSASGTVSVNPLPTVTVNSATVCTGTSATVTATPGTAGSYNYVWTVPTGAANPGNIASFTTIVPGTYSVIITNTATTCASASASGTVNNNAVPTVTVNNPSICSGGSATVTATPGASGSYSYAWTVPTGASNPGNVASFATTTAGTYSVIITNTITTCSSASASGTVSINANPTVTVNSPSICTGATATVTAIPGVAGTYSYVWTVPAGVPNPGNVASFTTSTAGNYSVVITNTATTCTSASATGTVTVTVKPIVDIVNNTPSICSGEAVDIVLTTSNAPGAVISWQFSSPSATGGSTGTGVGPIHLTDLLTLTSGVLVPTVVTFTVYAELGCLGESQRIDVLVNPKPTMDYTVAENSICTGTAVAIDLSSIYPNATFVWTSSSPSGNINGASNQTTPIPGNAANPEINDVLSTIGSTSGTVEYVITPIIGNCAGAPVTVTITVNPRPIANFGADPLPICSGNAAPIPMSSADTNVVFQWTLELGPNVDVDGGVLSGVSSSNIFELNQVFTVSGTAQGTAVYTVTPMLGNCGGTVKTYTVYINPLPNVVLNGGFICIDSNGDAQTSHLLDTGLDADDYTFVWYHDGVVIPLATGSSYLVNETDEAGAYSVLVTNDATTCFAQSNEVLVQASNTAVPLGIYQSEAFSDDTTITVVVTGSSATLQYQLDGGAVQNSNVFTGVSPGMHTVHVSDANGCTNFDMDIYVMGYPHFFTPNGDGYNDTWNIWDLEKQPNAEIMIFDRYGKLIKQITPKGDGWDGTYNGQLLPSTDYWFTVKFNDNGTERIFKAHFSMKR